MKQKKDVSLEGKGKEPEKEVNSERMVKEHLKGEKGEDALDTEEEEEEEEEETLDLEEEMDKDSQEEWDTTGGDIGEPEGGGPKGRKVLKRVSKTATLTGSTDQIKSGRQTRTRAKVADAQTMVSTRAKRKHDGTEIGNEGSQKKK